MSEPINRPSGFSAFVRNSRFGLALGVVVSLGVAPTQAGSIKHSTVHTSGATVQIKKADPWSGYWTYALNHHLLKLSGPPVHTVLTLSADGTLPSSPFVQYMVWRESLNAKRFDSFHPLLAQTLKKVKTPPTTNPTIPPETIIPPTGGTPILPPDFTPVTQGVNPPNVPEPSSGLIAVGMISAVVLGRRWAKTRS